MAHEHELRIGHVCLARGYKGNERQTELLIKELASLGVPQFLVCRDDSPLPFHLEGVKNLKIHRIRGVTDPRFIGHFRLARRCTILHAHDSHAVYWSFVHYMIFGTPYIITHRRAEGVVDSFFARTVYKSAKRVIAISKGLQDSLSNQLNRKIDLVTDCSAHLQVNAEIVARIREAVRGRFVVGNVGSLINRKNGQSLLIDAARILLQKIPELMLIFVGSGDDLKLLKMHADGLPNVKFVGFKRNFIDYIASFDVFVYPINEEGVGSVLLDVMEQGIPVIATKVGGVSDLVRDGETGLLIDAGNADQLAHCILRFKKDQGLYSKVRANCMEEAARHSSDAMAASYYRIYTKVINNSSDDEQQQK